MIPSYPKDRFTSNVRLGTSVYNHSENIELEFSFTNSQTDYYRKSFGYIGLKSLEYPMRAFKKKLKFLNLCMDFKLDIIILLPIDRFHLGYI